MVISLISSDDAVDIILAGIHPSGHLTFTGDGVVILMGE